METPLEDPIPPTDETINSNNMVAASVSDHHADNADNQTAVAIATLRTDVEPPAEADLVSENDNAVVADQMNTLISTDIPPVQPLDVVAKNVSVEGSGVKDPPIAQEACLKQESESTEPMTMETTFYAGQAAAKTIDDELPVDAADINQTEECFAIHNR